MKQEYIQTKNEIKRKRPRIDFGLLSLIIILLTLGTFMIFSASYPYASNHYSDGFYYIKRHLIFLFIGVLLMLLISRVNILVIRKFTPFFYIACIVLLILVLFTGFSEGIAKRWLGIPGTHRGMLGSVFHLECAYG